ncbi:hypothetical protein M413DRAFT_29297 [Hebeloma cylindrosporum]|uniref:AIG1-type G domain-containing protein n=1 Tax=Hebeloma cylindrosporum TaxID=76867 RepID=A0A0C3C5S9_HEBCY|nr:hypothetical protein M413DRAFT_29297 [Hebeloma cylindrosporum h7]
MAHTSSSPPKATNTTMDGFKDIVIPVLGPTGSGKSTFVNTVLGSAEVEVGHHTTSCSKEPYPAYVLPIPDSPGFEGYRLVILDTPGFDDTSVADVDILKRIAEWLAESRHMGALVGGVLYLHDITIKRFTSTASNHLNLLSGLCGEDCMKKTVLVITNWDSVTIDESSKLRREKDMKEKHWKPIIQQGATVHRFLRNRDSAWAIIDMLLKSDDLQKPLLLQTELVDRNIAFPDTTVGRKAHFVEEQKKGGRKKQKKFMDRLGCVIQ